MSIKIKCIPATVLRIRRAKDSCGKDPMDKELQVIDLHAGKANQ